MNLMHLKYAVVIAETNSMTRAAEKLYTAQPNLSRSLRELENTMGVTLFQRTSKGIYPTPEGEEFLVYARRVLGEVEEMEALFRDNRKSQVKFSISVPRASYISEAFASFVRTVPAGEPCEIFYKETNALRAINNIVNSDYKLGILRYQSVYDGHFKELLKEKNLDAELIFEFRHQLLMSRAHPLASAEHITLSDLSPYTEIAHADPFVPSMSLSTVRKNEVSEEVDRHVFVFERGSQMELLSECPDTFMWVSPLPQKVLDRYGLAVRDCEENDKWYKDVLIHKKEYMLTDTDKRFIDELMRVKREIT